MSKDELDNSDYHGAICADHLKELGGMNLDTYGLGAIATALKDAATKMAPLAETLAAMTKYLQSAEFKTGIESSRLAAERLATLGWTLPMGFTPRSLAELGNSSAGEIDAVFVEYYTANDNAELHRFRAYLLSRPALVEWHALLSECFQAFEQKKYLITIPSLLLVFEGIVANAGNALRERKIGLKAYQKICASKVEGAGGGVKKWKWRTVELFVSQLFQDAPFDQSRPSLINRNWILHGRDPASWTIADSLRLFNALITLC